MALAVKVGIFIEIALLPRNDGGFRIPSAEIIGSSPMMTQLGNSRNDGRTRNDGGFDEIASLRSQ